MTGIPGEGWKVFAEGDDSDNVPLWQALAQFTSDDLDEGLKANAAVLNQVKPPFVRYYNLAFVVSMGFGFLFVISLIGLLISVPTRSTDVFSFLSLATLAAAAAPHVWRQIYQYGVTTPDGPLESSCPPNRHFDEILAYVQKCTPSAPMAQNWGCDLRRDWVSL